MKTSLKRRKLISKYTKEHPEINRKKARKYQAKMVLLGKCYKCGKKVWRKGSRVCKYHLEWNRKYYKKYYKLKKDD